MTDPAEERAVSGTSTILNALKEYGWRDHLSAVDLAMYEAWEGQAKKLEMRHQALRELQRRMISKALNIKRARGGDYFAK